MLQGTYEIENTQGRPCTVVVAPPDADEPEGAAIFKRCKELSYAVILHDAEEVEDGGESES